MIDLTTKNAEELKAIEDAAGVVRMVEGSNPFWNADAPEYAPALALLKGEGFTWDDEYDLTEIEEDAAKAARDIEREEFYAKGPRVYSEDELFNMLELAAHRAHHVNAKPATDQQCRYLAKLVASMGGRDPFDGNTNDVLTSKKAQFMIDVVYRR